MTLVKSLYDLLGWDNAYFFHTYLLLITLQVNLSPFGSFFPALPLTGRVRSGGGGGGTTEYTE
jgi:hypothetical protein